MHTHTQKNQAVTQFSHDTIYVHARDTYVPRVNVTRVPRVHVTCAHTLENKVVMRSWRVIRPLSRVSISDQSVRSSLLHNIYIYIYTYV
jgi:hypothetical protein